MALSQRLEFRQSQALVMTPQLMQAIKLLQLSNLDLTAYVEGELEKNPLLERTSEGPDEPSQPGDGASGGAPEGSGEAADGDWKTDVNGSAAIEDSFDTGIENVFPDAEAPARPAPNEPAAYSEWAGVGSGGREDGDYNLEAFVSAEATLADHLGEPLVPDVYVRVGQDGGWLVELNSDTLPKVLVNQSYYAEVSKTAKNGQEKSYLADCLQTATWLMRALDQRAKTILKVSTEIVRQQDAFFAHGVQFLRPLNLKTVADAISMHESTVSRVTANKYMATSRGIFELKYFFTSSIAASDGGEAHSAEAVRHRIKQLIDAESAQDVLSDDTIVERLRGAGIDIARRTVAKYREAMRIPSSVQRRREKQSLAGAAS